MSFLNLICAPLIASIKVQQTIYAISTFFKVITEVAVESNTT